MKQLREGFTTGSCAAACALASCLWQRDGACPEAVSLTVPEGKTYAPRIHPLAPYRCAVYKDSGDDPDVTNGCEVWAEVAPADEEGEIRFLAGEGVGVITKPGLKLPPGEAAINPVPRQMIASAVRSVFGARAAAVTVGITGGRALAEKTFNPRLGVEGGLSVLGTTGVVHPMSEQALVETIRLEMSMLRALGAARVAFVFGAQGEQALKRLCPGESCVVISNFVGEALDEAEALGFESVLLAGQPGKLAKVSGGCMQTHSKYGDGRRENLCAALALMGAPKDLLHQVMQATTLDGLIPAVASAGYGDVWSLLCERACAYAGARVHGKLRVSALMLDASGCPIGEYKNE